MSLISLLKGKQPGKKSHATALGHFISENKMFIKWRINQYVYNSVFISVCLILSSSICEENLNKNVFSKQIYIWI